MTAPAPKPRYVLSIPGYGTFRFPDVQAMPDSTVVTLLDSNGVEVGRLTLGDLRRLGPAPAA
jgi:hypothetical protein